jgi:hypothetical protein
MWFSNLVQQSRRKDWCSIGISSQPPLRTLLPTVQWLNKCQWQRSAGPRLAVC